MDEIPSPRVVMAFDLTMALCVLPLAVAIGLFLFGVPA